MLYPAPIFIKGVKCVQANLKSIEQVMEQVGRIILGKDEQIKEIMLSFLANGHILLEDIPGVGKTTLALAFSKAMSLEYKRVQFTPDVMPSDLTGFSIYRRESEQFVYQPGSVFCNLLLADEINRTSPKTQSALLEVMEERKVTAEGITREVPSPFMVIATQNPFGSVGTQHLPEAQVDRFMISMSLGYPDFDSELQEDVQEVYINEAVYRYIVQLITNTRENPYLNTGVSPRGTIALVRMARAAAWIEGRDYVTPNDVKKQFPYVISHRITLNAAARMENIKKQEIVSKMAEEVSKPPMGEGSR